MKKSFLLKVIGTVCVLSLLLGALYVPMSFGVGAASIPVTDDETILFSFEPEEDPIVNNSDDENYSRAGDGCGIAGFGLSLITAQDVGVNCIGHIHNADENWPAPGGYRLNNKDGVYNLETSTTYQISFKVRVKSGPIKEGSLTSDVSSVLRVGYGFTGVAEGVSGNKCSKMHVAVAEVVKAQSVDKTDKANATFTLTDMLGSTEHKVGDDWHEVSYVFTTPEAFGQYAPSLGFFTSVYHGTNILVDEVYVTKLSSGKGAVVLLDEYSGTSEIITGAIGSAVELPELTGTNPEHDFEGWFKDESRTETAEGLTFEGAIQTVYSAWKAPVTVTFIDTLNGGEPYTVTGVAGEEIVYPENPVDNVNEPDENWFMGWYTTESYTDLYTAKTFGYKSYSVYAKWVGEYASYAEDFENYTLDTRGSVKYDPERGNVYTSYYCFGTALQKLDDPTNSGKGKVVALPWDSTQTKVASDRNSDPASYDAASFYKGADNIVQVKKADLEVGVTYSVSFEYFVEEMANTNTLTIHPIAAHESGFWGSYTNNVNFKNDQSAYALITPAEKDGEWHTAQLYFTMKKSAPDVDVIHFLFDLAENSDATVYVDNFTFTPVQPYESAIVYVANNETPNTLVKGAAGEAIEEYIPDNSGLAFGGWYTESAFENKYEEAVFGNGVVTLYAKWDGAVINFTNAVASTDAGVLPISFSVANYEGAGVDDNWAFKWHYDGDVVWVDEAKSLMYQRSSVVDHILALKTLEKGKTYQVKYWLNVEKATNDFNVQFCTTNPGYVWDPVTTYGSTYQNISKDEAGKGWKQYTTLLTVDTDPNKLSGLYMGLLADKRTIDDDVVVYIDKVSIIPVETGAIIFNTGIVERDGDWQIGNVGDKINYPVISGVRADLFDGWFADKECTVPYTYETIQEGVANVYAKWSGTIDEFIDRKKGPISSFGQAMYVENNKAGFEDDWAIKWHYDGDAEWKEPKSLMYQRGTLADHVIGFGVQDKGVYEISYWLNVEKATNDFSVQFFTTNSGWVWDPTVTYGSSYKTISKDAAGKGWIRYSVMINIDTEKKYVEYEGRPTVDNNGLFMSFIAIDRTLADENIVYVDAVVIKPVDTAVIFNTNSTTTDGSYQKGKAGEAIKFPADPVKPGYDFTGWYADKECTVAFTETVLKENTVYTVYAGYKRSKTVMYDFEVYNFSNPTGWFVWDEGGEVALFDKAFSGKKAARFNRDLTVTHNGRASFTLVGHGNEGYTVDSDKEYLVTFKYYVEKAGEKDAKISFSSGHPSNYWHRPGSLSASYVVPFSEKTGVWYDGVLVLDGSKAQDQTSNAVFVAVSGGDNGIYYIDDVEISVIPEGYKAYTVDNGGCDKVPMYVMGKLGTSFVKLLPNAPTMDNHHFGGYSMYDVNNTLSDLLPEKMVFSEENIRIVANFIRIETLQDFDDGYDALLNAYGDYSAMDFDYEHYDSLAEGNSKDNVTSGRYSLHRKGNTYHFENVQILTANKSLTLNQKYTVTMKVKLGKHFHTDGALKFVSCRTPYYPWASSGDYFSIAAIKDLKEGEWTEVSFTFTAVESFISLQTPGYVELFIDDVKFTRVDGTVPTSKSVSFTEYVPAKRDADGNLVVRNPMDVSVESIIDANIGKNTGSPVMLYVVIGGAAVLVIAAVVVLLILKKRKTKKA